MKIVNMKRLNSALADVIHDFEHLEIWNQTLYSIEVRLVNIGICYGCKWDGRDGHIDIPAVSLNRLSAVMFGDGADWCLRDVLRHEYGHAAADLYPRLSRSAEFRKVFGGRYDCGKMVEQYDAEKFISTYAATNPAEDFAEMFMYYIKFRGRAPKWRRFNTPTIKRKWRFIDRFVKTVRSGGKTFH